MSEDNGEPDVDLPPLDPTQRISKFEFDSLCLCQVYIYIYIYMGFSEYHMQSH